MDSKKQIKRLADLDAVRWVTGLEHGSSSVRRLDAVEIAEIADLEMHQPYPGEPDTWSNAEAHGKYLTVMAIVATPSSDRGAQLVSQGLSHDNQLDGLAIGDYSKQQRRLASLTGECSEGCSLHNIRLRALMDGDGHMHVEQVCRHTLAPCKSCLLVPTEKRVELLERLFVECRGLIITDSGSCDWQSTIYQLVTGKVPFTEGGAL